MILCGAINYGYSNDSDTDLVPQLTRQLVLVVRGKDYRYYVIVTKGSTVTNKLILI